MWGKKWHWKASLFISKIIHCWKLKLNKVRLIKHTILVVKVITLKQCCLGWWQVLPQSDFLHHVLMCQGIFYEQESNQKIRQAVLQIRRSWISTIHSGCVILNDSLISQAISFKFIYSFKFFYTSFWILPNRAKFPSCTQYSNK